MTSSRSELGAAVVGCLVGGVLVLVAAGQPWAVGHAAAAPGFPSRTESVDGGSVVSGLRAIGWVGLAAAVAVLATRRWSRVVLGALVVLLGAATAGAVAAAGVPATSNGVPLHATGWRWAALVGALVLLAAGVLVAVRGRRWASMSARYDAPAAAAGTLAEPARVDAAPAPAGDRPAGDRPAGDRPAGDRLQEGSAQDDRALWDSLDAGHDPTVR